MADLNDQNRPLKKRRRPPLACEQCRSRKIRCDRESPCGPCTKSKIPTCTYAPTHQPKSRTKKPPSTEHSATGATNSVSELETGDEYLTGPNELFQSTPFFPNTLARSVSSEPSSRAGSASQSSSVDALLARVRQLENKLAKTEISHDISQGEILSHYEESPAPVKGTRGTVSKTRYFGQSHWLSSIELVSSSFKRVLLSRSYGIIADMISSRVKLKCSTVQQLRRMSSASC